MYKQEMENQNVKKDQGLKMLKSQLTEETIKVSELSNFQLLVLKFAVMVYFLLF